MKAGCARLGSTWLGLDRLCSMLGSSVGLAWAQLGSIGSNGAECVQPGARLGYTWLDWARHGSIGLGSVYLDSTVFGLTRLDLGRSDLARLDLGWTVADWARLCSARLDCAGLWLRQRKGRGTTS